MNNRENDTTDDASRTEPGSEPGSEPGGKDGTVDPGAEGGADHRSGYVALLGKPNVGKSTLLNSILGQKLSIVTRRPQTTRHRVLGILSSENSQIIFLDTPGIIESRYGLHRAMMRAVDVAIDDADLLLFLADATQDTPDTFSLSRLPKKPAVLVVNKTDLMDKLQVLPLVQAYSDLRQFDAVVPVSALTGYQVDVLLNEILSRLPLGPALYPKDMISEHPERFFVAEIIREKIFEQYRKEIPYSTQVNVVAFAEVDGKKDVVDAEIVVERQTQKGIIIGKGGTALKRVGVAARKDIEAFLGRPVYLRLFVKVREGWRDQSSLLRSYGYEG